MGRLGLGPGFQFLWTDPQTEYFGQTDGAIIFNQQAESVAELDDQPWLNRSGEFHLHEADILANHALTRAGTFSGHARTLPDQHRP